MKHWRGILTQNTGFSYLAGLDLNPQSLDTLVIMVASRILYVFPPYVVLY